MKTYRILFVLLAVSMVRCETIPARLFEAIEQEKQQQQQLEGSLLTAEEIISIKHMREEELLAHDVYTLLSGWYDLPVFRNIANSELVHTSHVKGLIEEFGLEDPAADHKPGIFTDASIQDLYNELTDMGKKSLEDAIIVGLTIEDLDIADIEDALGSEVNNEDVVRVYNALLMGSKNHLKAFHFHATRHGIEYVPQYISMEYFMEIVEEN